MSSSWRQSANQRRDARAERAPDKPAPHRSTKNTRRWCRGKKGVEHQPECRPYDQVKGGLQVGPRIVYHEQWRILLCTTCGKELELYCPLPERWGIQDTRPKPDWVV